LKPGYFSLDPGHPSLFQRRVEDLISDNHLLVIATSSPVLNQEQVRAIYSRIFTDKETPIPPEVQKLRIDLETYMTAQVFSYLVYGIDAQNKLKSIKQVVREQIGWVQGSFEVKNAIHVPDKENFVAEIKMLFLVNKC